WRRSPTCPSPPCRRGPRRFALGRCAGGGGAARRAIRGRESALAPARQCQRSIRPPRLTDRTPRLGTPAALRPPPRSLVSGRRPTIAPVRTVYHLTTDC